MRLDRLLKLNKKIRVIGFDDACFDRVNDREAGLCGIVCANTRFEGMLWGSLTVDGTDVNERLTRLLLESKYRDQIHVILLDGITKHSLRESDDGASKGDEVGKFILPDGWFSVSEATIVPKEGKEGDYVLMIATNVSPDSERPLTSHVLILDGDNLDRGPVAAFNLPFFVPYGLHSHFVEWSKMA